MEISTLGDYGAREVPLISLTANPPCVTGPGCSVGSEFLAKIMLTGIYYFDPMAVKIRRSRQRR